MIHIVGSKGWGPYTVCLKKLLKMKSWVTEDHTSYMISRLLLYTVMQIEDDFDEISIDRRLRLARA